MGFELALMGISTALGAASSIAESRSMAAEYKSKAKQAEHSYTVNRLNAQQEAQEGASREAQVRRQGRQEAAALGAALSQSGLYGGTSTGVQKQSLINAELDALNTRYNAESRANAYNQSAINSLYEAKNYNMYAKGARNSMWGGVLGSVLDGAISGYGAGLFGSKALGAATNIGGLALGLADTKKPGFSLMGNRTASRGGFGPENLLGGL